jgi:hypothetical protein
VIACSQRCYSLRPVRAALWLWPLRRRSYSSPSSRSIEQARASVHAFQRLRVIAIPAFLRCSRAVCIWRRGTEMERSGFPLSRATLLMMLVGGLISGRRMARFQRLLSASTTRRLLTRSPHRSPTPLSSCPTDSVWLGRGHCVLMTTQPGGRCHW